MERKSSREDIMVLMHVKNNRLELREGDELRFGCSTRSYVLLNENSGDYLGVEEE